jgi:hypothetical protein
MIGKPFDLAKLFQRPGDPTNADSKSATTSKAAPKLGTATPAPKKKSQRRRLPGEPEA